MANVNKVEVNGQTIVDLTSDTVDEEHLAEGFTAHDASGAVVVGKKPLSGGVQSDWNETDENSGAYIRNKPFGKTKFAVSWDGTPTGEPVMHDDFPWYRIAKVTPDPESIRNVYTTVNTVEAGAMRFACEPEQQDGLLLMFITVPSLGRLYSSFVAYDGNAEGFEAGMYCVDTSVMNMMLGMTVTSVSAEWVDVKKIDYKYLPDTLQFGTTEFSVSWDGTETEDSFNLGGETPFYRVSDVAHPADELENVIVRLQTPAGDVSSLLTPDYLAAFDTTLFHEDQYSQYSGGEAPAAILYKDNYFKVRPGLYIADLTAMSQFLGTPINGVSIAWTQVRKIDPIYIPSVGPECMVAHNPVGYGSFAMNVAEGYEIGAFSHTEGDDSAACGGASHAEGCGCLASGWASHAEGWLTQAIGETSHAEGEKTIANGENSHVQGKYNVADDSGKFAHIVGGGTHDGDRKNIHTLDWGGNAVYIGTVTAADPTEDSHLVTKRYADSVISALENKIVELERRLQELGG